MKKVQYTDPASVREIMDMLGRSTGILNTDCGYMLLDETKIYKGQYVVLLDSGDISIEGGTGRWKSIYGKFECLHPPLPGMGNCLSTLHLQNAEAGKRDGNCSLEQKGRSMTTGKQR